MAKIPKSCTPLIVGDFNIDLKYPCDDGDKAVAKAMDAHDVSCFTRHISQRQGRLI